MMNVKSLFLTALLAVSAAGCSRSWKNWNSW